MRGDLNVVTEDSNMGPLVEVPIPDYDEAVAADLDLRNRITQRLETEPTSAQ